MSRSPSPDAPAPLLVVLDMDETLIHATQCELDEMPAFHVEPYEVHVRPHLRAFLETVQALGEAAVWSAASPFFVEAIVPRLFEGLAPPAFAWAQDRCTLRRDPQSGERRWFKPLSTVVRDGYDPARILIVDDSPEKIRDDQESAIHVTPFVGQADDRELARLARYLPTLRDVPDVRQVPKDDWRGQGA